VPTQISISIMYIYTYTYLYADTYIHKIHTPIYVYRILYQLYYVHIIYIYISYPQCIFNNIYKYIIIILKRSIRSLSSRSHARGSSRGGPDARVQELQQLLQLQPASTYTIHVYDTPYAYYIIVICIRYIIWHT